MGKRARTHASPDATHPILIEDFLVADDKHPFNLSLGNQHSIKWILVVSWQHPGTDSVVARYSQGEEVFPIEISTEILH